MGKVARIILVAMVFFLLSVSLSTRADDYKLGPGDVISLTIFAGGKVQNQSTLTVSGQGTIPVPFLGEIKAEGLTINQLIQKITRDLKRDYFVNPIVNISIKEYRSKKAYILGEVKKPGLYEIKGDMTLLSLISMAGGINAAKAGNYALILRGQADKIKSYPIEKIVNKERGIKINLKKLFSGDLSSNIRIMNSDLVYIPSKQGMSVSFSKIYVMGRVRKPGAYEFQEGLTVLNACIMAGGFDPFAAPSRASVTRMENGKKKIIKINLERVRDGKDPDILLKPGDRIYIPQSRF